MSDLPVSQRARELLAESCERHGFHRQALTIREGTWSEGDGAQCCLDAIESALTARQREVTADEFNRGVLIAVSTLINCWGHSTNTEHLLAMIHADRAMVARMGFDDYDRVPLLAALQHGDSNDG